MAPIFQPEAVACEIVRAAREAPRELWVGHSTLNAIIGTMLLPGTADRSQSPEGCDGELTDEAWDSAGPDNLFSPPAGDPGMRGRFDNQALTTVIGFDPAHLRAGRLLFVLTSIAGAFIAGAFIVGRLVNGRAVR